jgi:hypothetical protein
MGRRGLATLLPLVGQLVSPAETRRDDPLFSLSVGSISSLGQPRLHDKPTGEKNTVTTILVVQAGPT